MQGLRVLVVEDEALIAEEIADRLGLMGCTVVAIVDTGARAIELARTASPELVLMDIRLKGPMDGIEAGDLIGQELGLPVVFLTAHSDQATLERAMQAMPYGYVLKPFEIKEVVRTIEIAVRRSRVDRGLRDSQLSYRTIVDGVDEGVLAADREGRIRYLNARAAELTGWPVDAALGRAIDEVVALVREDAVEDGATAVAGLLRQGAVASWLTVRGGNAVPVDATVSEIIDGGQSVGLSVLLRDTRVQRRAERQFRDLVESAPDALVIVTADGRIELVNAQAESMFGYRREEIVGQPLQGLLVGRFAEDAAHAEGDAPDRLGGLLGRRSDGVEFPVEIRFGPIESEQGAMTAVAIRDVSRRYLAEIALRRSEERLRTIVENAPAALAVLDHELRYVVASQRWIGDYGLDAEHLIGHRHDELLPDIPAHWKAGYQRSLAGELVSADEDRYEWADGRVQWVRWVTAPWHLADGRIGGIMLMTEDVTAARHARDEIRALNETLEVRVAERTLELTASRDEAQRLARVKSAFLANMSHEIRTPLAAVLGLARIGERDSAGRSVQTTFEGILNAGQHLMSVINDILDVSKLESGEMQLESRPFSIESAVDVAMSFVAVKAESKGLRCTMHIEPACPSWVRGDPQRLQQILVNLLANAVKFTDAGEVRLDVGGQAGQLSFMVTDTGVGIAEEHLPTLFDPFTQADSSHQRRHGGTGLGLAICRSLVAAMGGHIAVSSQIGTGSRFTVSLPLAAAEPQTRVGASSGRPGLDALRSLRALVVDDLEVNRLILSDTLRHYGATVDAAESGLAALECIAKPEAGAYDVVLMDMQMPEMDGLEAASRIRSRWPSLPVIGVTASALTEERDRCLAAGMVDHVAKPIDEGELVAAIRRHVTLRAREASAAATQPRGKASAPPASRAPSTAIVDWDRLQSRYAVHAGLTRRLVGLALDGQPAMAQELDAAIRSGDGTRLGFIAHRLKGLALNLEASELAEAARATELAASHNAPRAAELAVGLGERMEAFYAELRMRSQGLPEAVSSS